MQIVIVDDEPAMVGLLENLVRTSTDHAPRSFTAPDEALEWCKHHPCDLLILDHTMSPLNGPQMVRGFRSIPGNEVVPVMMLTGDQRRETCHQSLQAGATDFLTKPVDAVEFMARTRNMLQIRQGQVRAREEADSLELAVRAATAQLAAREQEIIHRLCRAAEIRDAETGGHIIRVGLYSKLIARNLGYSPEEQDCILRAAPMHDIGKVSIPDHILFKPSRLTDEEWTVMMSHTTIGHQVLSGSECHLLQCAAEIALSHHEKFDGTGYPRGYRGDKIPFHGRIVAVADVFDALVSDRPYRSAWDDLTARELLLRNCGSHFDPDCVAAFIEDWEAVLAIRSRVLDWDFPLPVSHAAVGLTG